MKKVFFVLVVGLIFIAFFPNKIEATNVQKAQFEVNTMDAKAWMSRCPNGCQWDTQVDCGDRGARSCTTGNGCGNCNNNQ